MKYLATAVAIFFAAIVADAIPVNLTSRQTLAQVITQCTVPNTAALTVCWISFCGLGLLTCYAIDNLLVRCMYAFRILLT